jgi:hypothetical protein
MLRMSHFVRLALIVVAFALGGVVRTVTAQEQCGPACAGNCNNSTDGIPIGSLNGTPTCQTSCTCTNQNGIQGYGCRIEKCKPCKGQTKGEYVQSCQSNQSACTMLEPAYCIDLCGS